MDIKPVAVVGGAINHPPEIVFKGHRSDMPPRGTLFYDESALSQAREEGRREGMRDAAKCRSAVPVLPGEMPDAMWEAIRMDKDTCTEAMRIAVRQTLDEYEEAITRASEGK